MILFRCVFFFIFYSLCLCGLYVYLFFFFFKQKTAYEMRISDWSSDVCSSDLCELCDADGVRHVILPQKQIDGLSNVTPREAPFLYSTQSPRLLLRSRLGILRNERAADLTDSISDVFGPGQGASIHIQAGELRGRLFIGTSHGWSPAVLLRCLRIQEGIDLFLEIGRAHV